MGHAWQLQEAKNKFSKLVECARKEGPQFVSKHGKESVVVLSVEEYRKLTSKEGRLSRFFEKSPLKGCLPDIERDKSPGREVDL
jgi:prevent-host-death family protein